MKQRIKNRIIAISGEPVSGKGTAIKQIIKNLKEEGFKEENIHLIATGHQFRDYFEKIIEFMKSIDDPKKLKELGQDEVLKKIIENNEYRSIIIKTISKIQKNNIDLNDINKISELNNSEIFAELRNIIDKIIEDNTKAIGEEINQKERPNEIWIFDSRIAFNYIPNAFSVKLTVSSTEAARRLINDTSRGEEDRYKTIEEAEIAREERRIGEIKRYKEKYGINLEDDSNFDLIIDTTFAEIKDIAKTILRCEELYREGKHFGRNWASSFTMIPSQTIMETLRPQIGSVWTLEKLEKEIKEKRI